ncbi:hypothetical protein ACUDTJ_06505 [Stenotrophomonas pavanii]|uniref:hypothetical protein n=1 Tax=Stenotrophomonas TaxID=40323 RepID=UPI00122F6602|nr:MULTISPECIES: hypothetical protein [Stenotrophomonas]MBN5175843.1 hypothetical protein [Stenotrophomonas maltophilia]MCU1121737.1 hypothetical protein [Stenotrophomonas maltophilia]MDQ7287275.1 hypothetical protein [Stenotrophomonas sp. Sm5341]
MNAIVVWKEPQTNLVPKSADSVNAIAQVATNLSSRDQKQIVSAFQSESFEMMAGFVLNKALSQLKRSLASLGMTFVGEMLGRADISEESVPTVSISDYEAITLARELGVVNSTDAMRLTQHLELLAHFDGLNSDDAETEEMSRDEALSFLRTCINAVLGRGDNVAPVEFVAFRSALEERTFKDSDPELQALAVSPYFFKKTTLSILIAAAKTKAGAQFEHTLGNIVVIVPILWKGFRDAERYSLGQAYAEAVSSGSSAVVLALKKALSAVQGFDFVPESLRSQSFAAAAANVISVHTAMNNFYNEPSAIQVLARLGTTIPWPAFPICMSAILAVKLGNSYGVSHAAISTADQLLARLTKNQWEYYVNECLPADNLVLQKLAWYDRPRSNWIGLFSEYELPTEASKEKNVSKLLQASRKGNESGVAAAARVALNAIGE